MLRKYLGVLAILAALFIGATGTITPAMAQTNGEVPGTALGIKSDTDLWRFVRTGKRPITYLLLTLCVLAFNPLPVISMPTFNLRE